ncbi:MAG: creatinine deaminase [Candidatus Azotimanducaceae bacterium]
MLSTSAQGGAQKHLLLLFLDIPSRVRTFISIFAAETLIVFLMTREKDPFMEAAIGEAQIGLFEGGIPIGSVLVHQGKIIGRGHNQRIQHGSVIRHGEMDAFENAGRQPASVYRQCVLYTTLSPCAMCSGASLLYGIPKIVIGENQTFMGAEETLRGHKVELIILQDPECLAMMRSFIADHPELWNEDIGE